MERHPIDIAAEIVGSQAALASALGISKAAVSQWKEEGRRVPAEHCPAIERLTNRRVRCEDLRGDIDWAYLRELATPAEPKVQAAPRAPRERASASDAFRAVRHFLREPKPRA